MPYSALIDQASGALLALTPYPYVAAILSKSKPLLAEQHHSVDWPNYRKSFPLFTAPVKDYPSFFWAGGQTRLFKPTPAHVLTDELRQRSALAVVKVHYLWEIVYELSVARFQIWRGVAMQEQVYTIKRQEAETFRAANYINKDPLAFPFLNQYAELAEITMREAADEILFKAKLDDGIFLRTERIRLTYFNLLLEATSIAEIECIMIRFRNEAYGKRMF